MSESRETNYSSYPASSKSSSKSVNNKGTQLSSSSSINLHGNKLIDHTNTRQLTTTSQEYTTDSSIRNYSTSSVEESKPAVVPTQQTNRKQPIGHSTVINPPVSTRISRGSDVQKSYVPHDIDVIHPAAKILPIPSPTTQSVAVETLANMSDLTEYTPSNFYRHDNTMVDSSTQATTQVTTSTQATDSINRATSTAKIQTDLITSTTTTRNTTTFIGIIYDGLISITSFLYRIKKMIFMILLMGLLLWAAVIYGAILGAAICTKTGGYPLFQITLPPSKPVFF
ncbi:uncharacterized protein LOC130676225 isoform X2 [Microplitis mediator]|nr:uncharacterized protein LOC130676225 isoform X2 [Microplitis mediator]